MTTKRKHIISVETYLYFHFIFPTPRSAQRNSAVGVRAHSFGLSRPLCTQLQSLYLLPLSLNLDLQMLSISLLQVPITFHTSKELLFPHRASLYLYPYLPCDPCVGQLYLYFFTLFSGELPFDSTYYNSCSVRSTESLP